MRHIALAFILVFSSCSAIDSAKRFLDSGQEILVKVGAGVEKAQATAAKLEGKLEATMAEIDKDQDGRLSRDELMNWLLGGGGAGLLGLLGIQLRNSKSDQRKAKLEGKVDKLEALLPVKA